MKIITDNFSTTRLYVNNSGAFTQTPSIKDSKRNYWNINPLSWSKTTAECCKVYSNISFGNESSILQRQLYDLGNHYMQTGAILSLKNGFIENFAKRLTNRTNNVPLIIFIEGASGSGKSTSAKMLNELVNRNSNKQNPKSLIIAGDNFYTNNEECMKQENYDFLSVVENHPERETPVAFDMVCAYDVLNSFRDENTSLIKVPVFDHKHAKRLLMEEIRKPSELIIFDGLYAPENFEFDARIFIDTDRKIRDSRVGGERFKERHPESLNPEVDGQRLANVVGRMHDQYILPNRDFADVVISGNYDIQSLTDMYRNIISLCQKYI